MANSDDDLPPRLPLFVHAGKYVRRRAEDKNRLRDVQKDALHSLDEWFTDPETTRRTALVVMPTGTGKTGIMCCLPYYLASTKVSIDFSKPVLCIAPDLSILEQLTNEISVPSTLESPMPFLVEKGIIPKDSKKWNDALPAVKKVTSAAQLCEYVGSKHDLVATNAQKWHTLTTAVWQTLNPDTFSLVIVDEAHHLPANQWQRVVDKSCSSGFLYSNSIQS